MAIGRTGGFVRVTQAPVVDFGAMIRDAQDKYSNYLDKKVAFEVGYKKEVDGILEGYNELETKDLNFQSTEEVQSFALTQMQEEYLKDAKAIQDAQKNGDKVNLGILKGRQQSYNQKLVGLQNDLNYIASADNNLKKAIDNGDFTDGATGSLYTILDSLEKGQIKGAGYDAEQGLVLNTSLNGKDQKITLSQLRQIMENPPKNIKFDKTVNTFSDKFKTVLNGSQEGRYTDTEKKDLTDSHFQEIKDYANKISTNPNYINSAIYNALGVSGVYGYDELVEEIEKDENLKNKLGLTEDTDITPEDAMLGVSDILADNMFRNVRNRVDRQFKTEFDRSAEQADIKFNYEKSKDDEVNTANVIGFEAPEVGYYEDIIIPRDMEGQEQKMDEFAVSKSKIQNSREAVLDSPINIPSISGRQKGQTKTFKDVNVKGYIELDNGRVAVRFDYVEAEKLSKKKPSKRVTEKFDIENLEEGDLKEAGLRTNTDISTTSGGDSMTKEDLMNSTSLILSQSDSRSFLNSINISEDVAQKKASQDKPMFN